MKTAITQSAARAGPMSDESKETPNRPFAAATGSEAAIFAAAIECEEMFMRGTDGLHETMSPQMWAVIDNAIRGSFRAGFLAAVKTIMPEPPNKKVSDDAS